MGIPGACANYFLDEFVSVVLVKPHAFLACADGQDVGPVAIELAHPDPGILASSRSSSGTDSAIAISVLSVKTQNAGCPLRPACTARHSRNRS